MNKKIFSATLFGALMALSTGTFVSCQDYDDDIDNLQQQITNNSSAIAALESQIKSGEWVQSVTSTADGVVITLGNGNIYTINNGQDGAAGQNGAAGKDGAAGQNGADGKDGAAGQNGVTPTIAVNNGKIQVSYNDGSTWTDLISLEDLKGAQGAKGDKGEQGAHGAQGAAGISPTFSLGEDGHIYAQYGEDGEKKDLGVSTGGVYCVIDGVKLTIHAPNADGEYQDIVLPRAAAISSIKAVTITDGATATLADNAEITMSYGKAAADGKYFDGTAFKEGDLLLPTKETKSVISAQINPTIADATAYNFYLVDSKGSSIFNLSGVTPNKTEKALTRAEATANKGIYDMGVTLVSGVTEEQLEAASGTYAIATKDVYDNEILSAYDVTVTVSGDGTTRFENITTSKEVEINKEFDLNDLVETMENVIDVKYEFTSEKAAIDAAKASISGTKIKGGVAGKDVTVKATYMKLDGTTAEGSEITISFIKAATVTAYTAELTLKADDSKNKLTFDVTDLFDNTASSVVVSSYTIGVAKFTAAAKDKNTSTEYAKGATAVGITAPGGFATEPASATANGYYKHTLTYTVVKEQVIPGTYEAEVTYGESPVNTIKLTLVVKDPEVSYDFKPKSLLFNGTETTVYGTPNSEDPVKIEYNLKSLFGLTNWANVTFSETKPADKKVGNVTWSANAWLVNAEVTINGDGSDDFGKIKVDKATSEPETGATSATFGGAYEARSLKATYTPYGNKNLAAATYDFSVTVKSPVYEGSLEYVKAVESDDAPTIYVAGDTKTIKAGAPATLKADEIRGVTMEGAVYSAKSTADEEFGSGTHAAANVVSVTATLGGDAKDYLTLSGEDFASDNVTVALQSGISIPSGTTINGYVRVSVVDKWGKTKTVDVPVVLK